MNKIRFVIANAHNEHVSVFIALWRFIFKRCLDCGKKLSKHHDYGDVCDICFNNFNGATIEEIMK